MTHVERSAQRGAAAARGLRLTSLAALLLFGDWLIDKLEHHPAPVRVIEEARCPASSDTPRADAANDTHERQHVKTTA